MAVGHEDGLRGTQVADPNASVLFSNCLANHCVASQHVLVQLKVCVVHSRTTGQSDEIWW